MGLFDGKKTFKYVSGVTEKGKPIMQSIEQGSSKGQCNGKGKCSEHPTREQWERTTKPLSAFNYFYDEGAIEICPECKGRTGYLGEVPGVGNDHTVCSCTTYSFHAYEETAKD